MSVSLLVSLLGVPWKRLWASLCWPYRAVRNRVSRRPNLHLAILACEWGVGVPATEDSALSVLTVRVSAINGSQSADTLGAVNLHVRGTSLFPASLTGRTGGAGDRARIDGLRSGDGRVGSGVEARDGWLEFPVNIPPRSSIGGWIAFMPNADRQIKVLELRKAPALVFTVASGRTLSLPLPVP